MAERTTESRATDGSSESPAPDATDPDDGSVRYVVGSLIAGVFFGGLGGGVAYPTLPNLGPLLGITPFFVGVILSTNGLVRLVTNTPAGQVIDAMGARRPMVAGFVVQGLAPFGYVLGLSPAAVPLLDSTGIFLVSRALWGLGSAFVFVGAFSTITHVTVPANRGKWVGYMRGGQSLGFPTGLVVGGLVTDAFGYAEAFLVAGGFGMLAAVVAFAVLPDIRADVGTTAGLRAVPGMVRRDPRVLSIGGVNFIVRFLYISLLSTVVVFAADHGIRIGGFSSVGVSGAIMAVSVLAMSVTTLAAGRLSDGVSARGLVTLPALAALGVGLALVGLVPTLPVTLAGVTLIGIGVGGTNPPLLALLGDIVPEDQVGKMGGVYNVFGDLGATLGPVVAFPVGARVGYDTGYLVSTVLVAIAAGSVGYVLLDADLDDADASGQRAD